MSAWHRVGVVLGLLELLFYFFLGVVATATVPVVAGDACVVVDENLARVHAVEWRHHLVVLELLHERLGALGRDVEITLQHGQSDGVAGLDIVDSGAIQRVEILQLFLFLIVLLALELWWLLRLQFLDGGFIVRNVGNTLNDFEHRHATGACDGVVELDEFFFTLL